MAPRYSYRDYYLGTWTLRVRLRRAGVSLGLERVRLRLVLTLTYQDKPYFFRRVTIDSILGFTVRTYK